MQSISIYKYVGEGGTVVSPIKLPMNYTEMVRLVADEGMILTDGTVTAPCIDTETPEDWTEIEDTNIMEGETDG